MVKLTSYAAKGGCACKIGPHILAGVLQQVTVPTNDNVLVDMKGADDAGVYKLSETTALVQTLDFFTPVVDDPRTFGKIAAANSVSDIYAMGGRPITAMNIVGFPVPLVEQGVLTEVLNGAADILEAAGVAIVGGHSIENETPIFGLSVTGVIRPDAVWQNCGAVEGDALIITKPLGTGIMSTALKGGLFEVGTAEATKSMFTLNKQAAETAAAFTIHACTDITGFSLMGHGREMADGSGVSLCIDTKRLPLFTGTVEAAAMGLVPAATYGNRKAVKNVHFSEDLDEVWSDICFDPQTSGGLLLAVPAAEADSLTEALHRAGVAKAARIGMVIKKGDYAVYVK